MKRVILLVLGLLAGCKTTSDNNQYSLSESSLEQWGYELNHDLLYELGRRVGCQEASKWVIAPKKNYGNILREMQVSSSPPFEIMEAQIFSKSYAKTKCDSGVSTSQGANEFLGITKIYDRVKKSGAGLTIITVGGFGSHLGEGSLKDSRTNWEKHFADQGADFRISRFECYPNSYETDDYCAPELIKHFKKIDSKLADDEGHRYLLIGYSKGGTTSLQALANDQDFRDKTLATLTLSSPIGGGMAAVGALPLIQTVFSSDPNSTFGSYNYLVGTFLENFGPLNSEGSASDILGKMKSIMGPKNADIMNKGFKSLMPDVRQDFLRNTFASWNFSKTQLDPVTNSKESKVFHATGLSIIDDTEVVPELFFDSSGQLQVDTAKVDAGGAAIFGTIPQARDYPLNDSCVALEHSVIPKQYLPTGLDSSFLGALHAYHTNVGIMPSLENPGNILKMPGTIIIDSYLSLIAKRL